MSVSCSDQENKSWKEFRDRKDEIPLSQLEDLGSIVSQNLAVYALDLMHI